jgi:Raf kinase inhibitor-like YbhB/YbcL family protein
MTSIFSRLLAEGKQAIYTSLGVFLALFALEAIAAGIARSDQRPQIVIGSKVFTSAGRIPDQYTCVGADASPPLAWSGAPAGAKSLVLIVDDPDAPSGSFTHWIVYNLPTTIAGLSAGVPRSAALSQGGRQGLNDFGRVGYNGPCPPPGGQHHYHFRIFALDQLLQFNADPSGETARAAIRGHVLAEGETIGVFSR